MLGFQPRLIVIGECIVAIKDSQKRAVAKYNAANYDRVELRLEKGQKDVVKAHAGAQCESLNAFINRAIGVYTMEKDKDGTEEVAGCGE